VSIYLNGNRILYDSSWYGYIDMSASTGFSIGGTPYVFSGAFADFDDWRVEYTVRSEAYMQALYRAGKPC
jgi:hypothetical protein